MLTISGCQTIEYIDYAVILPPTPEREELKQPTTIKECAEIIAYYDNLVCLWELWGESVKEIINKKEVDKIE